MIDTHAHLTHLDYNESELKNVIKRMDNNIIIASGTNDSDNKEVIDLVNNYENIYGRANLPAYNIKGEKLWI